MSTERFTLSTYPQAILHIDGDAFFTSVEQSMQPRLKGRPVVTGKERSIITCASYEARALGIRRGVSLWEAKKKCPDLVVLPSDLETYGLFSKRMFDIVRRYTPMVEEYSMDEGFADISGLRRSCRDSYQDIPVKIQQAIREELDIQVSVGLSLTKVLAKLASQHRKPDGFTAVPGRNIHLFLEQTPLRKVWGFGRNTVQLLDKYGVKSAYDFAHHTEEWAGRMLGKPGREIWNELRGRLVYPVETEEKSRGITISKSRTVTPTAREDQVEAHLIENVERAFAKMRAYRFKTGVVGITLRTSNFQQEHVEAVLNRATSSSQQVAPVIKELFDKVYQEGSWYRATSVELGKLEHESHEQFELFDNRVHIEGLNHIVQAVDPADGPSGVGGLRQESRFFLPHKKHVEQKVLPWRKSRLDDQQKGRPKLAIPWLGEVGDGGLKLSA